MPVKYFQNIFLPGLLGFAGASFQKAKLYKRVVFHQNDNRATGDYDVHVFHTTSEVLQRESLSAFMGKLGKISLLSILKELFSKIIFMEIFKMLLTFGVGYFVILLWDSIWLGNIAKPFTIWEFWDLIIVKNGSIDIKLWVGLLAWAVIVALVFFFVIRSGLAHSPLSALGYGALMGCLSYAMYDLTNLTFLKNYSLTFTLVDIAWGTFLLAMVSLSMYLFQNWISKVF